MALTYEQIQTERVARNVKNARSPLGPNSAKIQVVMHGKRLGLLLAKNASENAWMKEKLIKLHADGVVFAACDNTMRREKVEKKEFVEQATTVDSGIGRVIRKQGKVTLASKLVDNLPSR